MPDGRTPRASRPLGLSAAPSRGARAASGTSADLVLGSAGRLGSAVEGLPDHGGYCRSLRRTHLSSCAASALGVTQNQARHDNARRPCGLPENLSVLRWHFLAGGLSPIDRSNVGLPSQPRLLRAHVRFRLSRKPNARNAHCTHAAPALAHSPLCALMLVLLLSVAKTSANASRSRRRTKFSQPRCPRSSKTSPGSSRPRR